MASKGKRGRKRPSQKKTVKRSKGKAARARTRVGVTRGYQFSSSQEVLRKRPRYLVIFNKESEGNLRCLHRCLKANDATAPDLRADRVGLLVSGRSEDAPVRLYKRLAIAAADLDDNEVKSLSATGEVRAVVRNERRTVPPPGWDVSMKVSREPEPNINSYLRGMRDAASAALAFQMDEAQGPLSYSAPFPAQTLPLREVAQAAHSWCLNLIGITPGYSGATGLGVKVAVLDTGIDLSHPDLAHLVAVEDNRRSFVADGQVQDGNGHGTHCAGIIAGPIQSVGQTRYGVAPDVTLLVGKVLDDQGSGYDDQILDGIDWADDNGAKIISMSFGSYRAPQEAYSDAYERVAEVLREQGVLLVGAAGNGSGRPFFTTPVENPAACPSIMAVAATDRYRRIAHFSSRQMDSIGEVNISAPGVDVYSAFTGGGFRRESGTSMATPHVAGVAALYLELNPGLSAEELWRRLQDAAMPLGDRRDFGYGLLRAP